VIVCGPADALDADPGIEVSRAESPEELRARIEQARVDCAVVSLDVAGGPEGLRELRRSAPSTAFLVLAEDAAEVRAAVRAGAHRCLPAGDVTSPMLRIAVTEAIERCAAGPGPASASAETVRRLARAIEYRNPETTSHVERMSGYCALLAGRAGLDSELIRIASRLHDLGKVAVPDSILLKPGPLTPGERREMERHAEIGSLLLQGSGIEFLDEAAVIAWSHHERFDGDGYPRRLAGEGIPLAGRIAALADAFDALSTDRVYRRALPFTDAVEAVREERGGQFDPELVDIFLDELDEVQAIMDRYADDPDEVPALREPELVTLQEAAITLGVTQSRLRRWSDEGRIEAVRTAGGHRRFAVDAVRRLAAELGVRPGIRPAAPPDLALPMLADRLAAGGGELATSAARSLYKQGPRGWFASAGAEQPLQAWLAELRGACKSGRYASALAATEALMRHAYVQGASLLERHGFLERFGVACHRALTLAGAPREELIGARRLFAALQQALLDGRD
jgi:excisionase family DNA binding protein